MNTYTSEDRHRAFNNNGGACSRMVRQQVSSTNDQTQRINGETGSVYALCSFAGFSNKLYYGLFYHPLIPWRADEITPYFYAHKINSYVY
jgi:hypothetical protein